MASAKKCDRCGKFFDPYLVGEWCTFPNPKFYTSADLKEQKVTHFLINGASPSTYVDLCPKCAEMFENFMCETDIPQEAQFGIPKQIKNLDEVIYWMLINEGQLDDRFNKTGERISYRPYEVQEIIRKHMNEIYPDEMREEYKQ